MLCRTMVMPTRGPCSAIHLGNRQCDQELWPVMAMQTADVGRGSDSVSRRGVSAYLKDCPVSLLRRRRRPPGVVVATAGGSISSSRCGVAPLPIWWAPMFKLWNRWQRQFNKVIGSVLLEKRINCVLIKLSPPESLFTFLESRPPIYLQKWNQSFGTATICLYGNILTLDD